MFTYNAPTKLFIDYDLDKLGEVIKSYGFKNVLFLYGGGSIKKGSLYNKVVNSLKSYDINFIEVSGVEPNPKVSFVREVLANNYEFDMILAVGGGSVIDTAKSIAVSYKCGIDPWKFNSHEVKPEKSMPIGVILTLSAAGSEMSSSCVITNLELQIKQGFNSEVNRPLFAIMNAELTYSVNKYQTACGITDIMAHVFERYFTNTKDVETTDRLCEAVLLAMINEAPKVIANPNDYQARANIMWAGMVAHNNIVGVGRSQDWNSHGIEHELSALYDCAHGAGLSVIMPNWMKFVMNHDIMRFCQMATRIWGCKMDFSNPEKTAMEGIEAFRTFLTSIGMPATITELGGKESDIPTLVKTFGLPEGGKTGGFVQLSSDDIATIYKMAL